jgi:nitrile hydratase accessory protein
MSPSVDRQIGDMSGAAALPRKNGELVFDELWEARLFGMAVALNERGLYPWQDFRAHLIAEIAVADAAGGVNYYESWLRAFERILVERGVLTEVEMNRRTEACAADDTLH